MMTLCFSPNYNSLISNPGEEFHYFQHRNNLLTQDHRHYIQAPIKVDLSASASDQRFRVTSCTVHIVKVST